MAYSHLFQTGKIGVCELRNRIIMPPMVKLCCDEYVDGGITINESRRIAQMLEDAGVDAIIANAGNRKSV